MANELNGEWERLVDPRSGLEYYHNQATGETQWEPPPGFGSDDDDDVSDYLSDGEDNSNSGSMAMRLGGWAEEVELLQENEEHQLQRAATNENNDEAPSQQDSTKTEVVTTDVVNELLTRNQGDDVVVASAEERRLSVEADELDAALSGNNDNNNNNASRALYTQCEQSMLFNCAFSGCKYVLLVDTRSTQKYAEGHVSRSKNFPVTVDNNTDALTLQQVQSFNPADFRLVKKYIGLVKSGTGLVVVYDDDTDAKGARMFCEFVAREAGITHAADCVYLVNGGFNAYYQHFPFLVCHMEPNIDAQYHTHQVLKDKPKMMYDRCVFVGSVTDANNKEQVQQWKISHIVKIGLGDKSMSLKVAAPDGVNVVDIVLDPSKSCATLIADVHSWIERARGGEEDLRLLLVDEAGAVMMLLAYLISTQKMSLVDARTELRALTIDASLQAFMWLELEDLELSCVGSSTLSHIDNVNHEVLEQARDTKMSRAMDLSPEQVAEEKRLVDMNTKRNKEIAKKSVPDSELQLVVKLGGLDQASHVRLRSLSSLDIADALSINAEAVMLEERSQVKNPSPLKRDGSSRSVHFPERVVKKAELKERAAELDMKEKYEKKISDMKSHVDDLMMENSELDSKARAERRKAQLLGDELDRLKKSGQKATNQLKEKVDKQSDELRVLSTELKTAKQEHENESENLREQIFTLEREITAKVSAYNVVEKQLKEAREGKEVLDALLASQKESTELEITTLNEKLQNERQMYRERNDQQTTFAMEQQQRIAALQQRILALQQQSHDDKKRSTQDRKLWDKSVRERDEHTQSLMQQLLSLEETIKSVRASNHELSQQNAHISDVVRTQNEQRAADERERSDMDLLNNTHTSLYLESALTLAQSEIERLHLCVQQYALTANDGRLSVWAAMLLLALALPKLRVLMENPMTCLGVTLCVCWIVSLLLCLRTSPLMRSGLSFFNKPIANLWSK